MYSLRELDADLVSVFFKTLGSVFFLKLRSLQHSLVYSIKRKTQYTGKLYVSLQRQCREVSLYNLQALTGLLFGQSENAQCTRGVFAL